MDYITPNVSPKMNITLIPQPDVELIHQQAPFNGDIVDDGQTHDPITDPPDNDTPMVTQDDNITPDVTEEVSYALETMADCNQSCHNSFEIVSHEFRKGILYFKCSLPIDEHETYQFSLMKRDYTAMTSKYIVDNDVGTSRVRNSRNRYVSLDRIAHNNNNVVRQTIRLYETNFLNSFTPYM